MRKLASAIILSSLAGCQSCPTVEPVQLPQVPTPVLPKIEAGDLECLQQTAYEALVERDARLKAALGECQAILRSTQ